MEFVLSGRRWRGMAISVLHFVGLLVLNGGRTDVSVIFTVFYNILATRGTDISVIFGMFCTKSTKCGRTDVSVIFKEFLHNSYDAGGRICPLF